jgi:anti-sigma factor RsiW
MQCEEVNRCLDAYLDRELPPNRQLELEQHLNGCPACQSVEQEFREFAAFFIASAPRYEAPRQLRSDIVAAIRREKAKRTIIFLRRPWTYAAAVLVAILTLNMLFLPDKGKELSDQAVLRHIRSLAVNHLVDIGATDHHAVKPWLAAKLNFSPPVVDLPGSGYSLVGGRTDVIQDRAVAAFVYKHDKEILTLFCWPPNREQLSTGDRFIKGYRVCTWSSAECNYILVSKLSEREMDEFEDSFRDHVQSGTYF